MEILKQKRLFTLKEFKISERSLRVRSAKLFDHLETEVRLEDISFKYTKVRSPNVVLFILSLGAIAGMLATIYSHFFEKNGSSWLDFGFYLVIFLVAALLSYITYNKNYNLLLDNGGAIGFYESNKGQEELNEFLHTLKQQQKDYLLQTYAKSDGYLTHEQIANNLQWLWHKKVIDDSERTELRNALIPRPTGGANNQMGFTFNTDNS